MKNISFYKKVSLLVLAVLVFGFFYSYRILSRSADFDINYKAGCLVREDKIEYVLQDDLPHKYPPIIGLYFSLYCVASHDTSRVLFFWASLIAITASFIIGMRLTGNKSLLTGIIIPALLILRSLLWELDLGNSNHLILLGLMLFIYFYKKNREYLSSMFLVLAAIIKLFPGLLFLYFIVKKKFRFVAYGIFNLFLLVFAVPFIFYGYTGASARVHIWLKALFANSFWTVYDHANQSILGALARLTMDTKYGINFLNLSISRIYTVYAVIFLLIVTALCVWAHREKPRGKATDKGIALTLALSVVLSPLCWIQTFMVSLYLVQLISPALNNFSLKNFKDRIVVFILSGWVLSQVPNPELMGNSLEDLLLSCSVMLAGWGFYVFALLSLRLDNEGNICYQKY